MQISGITSMSNIMVLKPKGVEYIAPTWSTDPNVARFVIVTDSHFGDRDYVSEDRYYWHAEAKTKAVILDAESFRSDFMISVGDYVDNNSTNYDTQFKLAFDTAALYGKTFYHTIGNHEGVTQDRRDDWEAQCGDSYYSFIENGIKGIVLDCMDMSATQIEWLRVELSKDNLPSFIFTHYEISRFSDKSTLLSHISSYGNVKAVFSGDLHDYSLTTIDGIPHHSLDAHSQYEYPIAAAYYVTYNKSTNNFSMEERITPIRHSEVTP